MSNNNQKIITRFAPSPTGLLHLGNYRTALFSYLFAKQNGGDFILRIEDTDKERSKKEYEADIIENLAWLKLPHDAFYRQSEHFERHQECLQKLIDSGHAYISKEEPKEPGDRDEVIRFKNPNRQVKFQDLIRGAVTFDTTDLGDFVIAKSLTEPIFHLAVVVDDADENITHVIRGEDHISNTPRQILLQEALGLPTPTYAHLPLILATDRTKLSKRNGAVSVGTYRQEGYLPEALVNFLALIGWNPGTDQELFSLAELVKSFDLMKVQKGGAVFNIDKLNWLNREYLKRINMEGQLTIARSYLPERVLNLPDFNETVLERLIPDMIGRINKFHDITELAEAGELDYYFNAPKYEKGLLKNQNHFSQIITLLEPISQKDFTPENIKQAVWDYATEQGRGEVLWPMRTALSGKEKSPDPFTLAYIIGKEETLKRLNHAANL